MDENQTQPPIAPTTDAAKYKKWFEWTVSLLLIAIIVSLVQIYRTTRNSDPAVEVETGEVKSEVDEDALHAEMVSIMDQMNNRPTEETVDGEVVKVDADINEEEVATVHTQLMERQSTSEETVDGEVVITENEGPTDMSDIQDQMSQRPAEDEASLEE